MSYSIQYIDKQYYAQSIFTLRTVRSGPPQFDKKIILKKVFKIVFREPDLNLKCENACESAAVNCVAACLPNDNSCLRNCIRSETECRNGKVTLKLIMYDNVSSIKFNVVFFYFLTVPATQTVRMDVLIVQIQFVSVTEILHNTTKII